MTDISSTRSSEPKDPEVIDVLFLEDRPDDADLLARQLEDAGYGLTWRRVDSREDFVEALGAEPDVVIADYNLPGFDGLEALDLHLAQGGRVPFILVSGVLGEEVAVEAIRRGAADYLLKDRLRRLPTAVARALEEQRLRERGRLADERIRALVSHGSDIAAVLDTDFRFAFMSPSVEQILGYHPDEYVGSPVTEMMQQHVHPDDLELALSAPRALEAGHQVHHEVRIRHKDGGYRWFSIKLSDHFDDPAVRGAVCNMTDVTEHRHIEAELEHQALHDSLTGLPNRALLHDRIEQALGRTRRSGRPVAVLFVDLDRFKDVNDSLGHVAGDQLLIEVAGRLAKGMRETDTVCRFGGDEFVIVVEHLPPFQTPRSLGERILGLLEKSFQIDSAEVYVTASIGIAVSDDGQEEADTLLRDADSAMYRAKEKGRNRCEVYETVMHARATRHLDLAGSLRRALPEDELEIHYQPIVSLDGRDIVGFEALLRWHSTEHGNVPPVEFIPIAEETGLIKQIGKWVLDETCLGVARWIDGLAPCVSVNISPVQLAEPGLVDHVREAITASGVAPDDLCLEITEGALVHDPEAALHVVDSLKELGVRLSIDDFGTGYSALAYLKRFPIDLMKIDRSFVSGLGVDPTDESIVSVVVEMAAALGVKVVAEGVETEEQRDWLHERGCHYAQGYLFGRPAPATDWDKAAVAKVRARLV